MQSNIINYDNHLNSIKEYQTIRYNHFLNYYKSLIPVDSKYPFTKISNISICQKVSLFGLIRKIFKKKPDVLFEQSTDIIQKNYYDLRNNISECLRISFEDLSGLITISKKQNNINTDLILDGLLIYVKGYLGINNEFLIDEIVFPKIEFNRSFIYPETDFTFLLINRPNFNMDYTLLHYMLDELFTNSFNCNIIINSLCNDDKNNCYENGLDYYSNLNTLLNPILPKYKTYLISNIEDLVSNYFPLIKIGKCFFPTCNDEKNLICIGNPSKIFITDKHYILIIGHSLFDRVCTSSTDDPLEILKLIIFSRQLIYLSALNKNVNLDVIDNYLTFNSNSIPIMVIAFSTLYESNTKFTTLECGITLIVNSCNSIASEYTLVKKTSNNVIIKYISQPTIH